jgi:suppressor of fused protein SUFU
MEVGGSADVLIFKKFVRGFTYVTADLTGPLSSQKRSRALGNYELAICTRKNNTDAAALLARLAAFTLEMKFEPCETMDIGDALGTKTITALLFTHLAEKPVHFAFLKKKYGLMLCIGITQQEVLFTQKHGTDALLELLKKEKVFPYTMPDRKSVVK